MDINTKGVCLDQSTLKWFGNMERKDKGEITERKRNVEVGEVVEQLSGGRNGRNWKGVVYRER